jgi:hypothetical protein
MNEKSMATSVLRFVRAFQRDLAGDNEDVTRFARLARQDDDGKPVELVIIAVADKMAASRKRARFYRDSLQAPIAGLGD